MVQPRFFFSYSRADSDKFLERFFEDLRTRAANLSGDGVEPNAVDSEERLSKVGFRDREGVKTGQDWKDKIGTAIQHAGVLVCMYSPNFFSIKGQYCGREFTAFLRRHDNMQSAAGTTKIRSTRHILPILWWSVELLGKQGLPPSALKTITWTIDGEKLNSTYLRNGIRQITKGQGAAYDRILNHFATLINEVAKNPLPPLSELPDIETLPNAWVRPNDNLNVSKGPTVATVTESATEGAAVVHVIEVRSTDADEWAPYGIDNIPALFERIASRRLVDNRPPIVLDHQILDPSILEFTDRVSRVLKTTTKKSVWPILVLDPTCLVDSSSRSAILALLSAPQRAGLLIPARADDENAVQAIEQYGEQLKAGARAGWLLRIAIGDQATFRTAATSVAVDLLSRIVTTDDVRQDPPDNGGLAKRPRIANQPEARE